MYTRAAKFYVHTLIRAAAQKKPTAKRNLARLIDANDALNGASTRAFSSPVFFPSFHRAARRQRILARTRIGEAGSGGYIDPTMFQITGRKRAGSSSIFPPGTIN